MADKYVQRFSQLSTFLASYMRDVTYTMHHNIQSLNHTATAIGRAFTVKGPDIYLNALESIPADSIYVHAHTNEDQAVWSALYGERYGKARGLVAAVIDGGIHSRKETAACDMPTFARFVCPLAATNREKGIIQVPVVCGGVTVCPGDIVLGDADGVVVIPQKNEDEIYQKLDGFFSGIALFEELSKDRDVVVSKHEALGEMLALKYKNPYDYWRYYEPWATKWRARYDNA